MPAGRHVTLVCGPPCSGKTTYVDRHAADGDVIACHDREARRAGSRRSHDHLDTHRASAERAWQMLVRDIAAAPDGRAWVIRCAPGGVERQALAERLRAAEVLLLMPPMAATLRRAELDKRSRRTFGLIRGWYERYTPAPMDTVLQAQRPASRAW